MKKIFTITVALFTLIILTACPQKEAQLNKRTSETIDSIQILHRLYSTTSPREDYFSKTIKNPTIIETILSPLGKREVDNYACAHSGVAMIYRDTVMIKRLYYNLDNPCRHFGRHELTPGCSYQLLRLERYLLDSLGTEWRAVMPRNTSTPAPSETAQ